MRVYVVFVLTVLGCVFAEDYRLSLEGSQALRVKCKTEDDLKKLKSFEEVNGFEVMRTPRVTGDTLDILVEADKTTMFKNYLEVNNISYDVFVDNFLDVVKEEAFKQHVHQRSANSLTEFDFEHFPRLDEINNYLNLLAYKYDGLVTLIYLGKSYEQRDMLAVKISTGGAKKPVVFIDAGIHAREWIAPTTALYIISELVKPENRYLIKDVDVIVTPSINPDGYEFTHTTNRIWRKTRSHNKYSSCRGVDPNRNFGYKWNVIGASQSPCSDIYSGPAPFSEVEARHVRDLFLAQNGTVKVYLTLHSYGQMLLHPWGWTDELPENEPVLRKVGLLAAEAIRRERGLRYVVGSSTIVLYAAAGGSDDWATAVGKADLAYTLELPGGRGGFVIDPEQITPVGHETFQAVKVFISYARSTAL